MIHASLWPAYARRLQASKLPILVGPWRGEVGFEALYWIPFIRRFAKRYNINHDRLTPVTRGGAAAFYGMGGGPDVFALREPKAVRVENLVQHAKYQQLKQTHWTKFDRELVTDAAKALSLTRYHVIHPGWLYACLGGFFDGTMSIGALEKRAIFDPLTVPAIPVDLTLPERFVAVRFYLRHTFPPEAPVVSFAQESIRKIASHTPVVLLNSGVHVDEHIDIKVKAHPNVQLLTDLCEVTPRNNLAVQAAVIGRALGFVGTYGGLAQLALRLGKPSVSYYHEWGGTSIAHKHLADAIALQRNIPCIVHKIGELPLMQTVVPAFQVGPS